MIQISNQKTPKNVSRYIVNYKYEIVLTIIIVLALILNSIWIIIDTFPPSWDQSHYAFENVEHAKVVLTGNPKAIFNSFIESEPTRGPLFSWIGVPFLVLLGIERDLTAVVNAIAIGILGISIYLIGKSLMNKETGLLAVICTLSFPIILGLARELLIDLLLTAMVAATIAMILQKKVFHSARKSACVGIIVGLGLLTKLTYPVFVFVPLGLIAYANIRGTIQHRNMVFWNILLMIGLISVICLPWYVHNSSHLWSYAYNDGIGISSTRWGPVDHLSMINIIGYLKQLPDEIGRYKLFFVSVIFLSVIMIEEEFLLIRKDSALYRKLLIILWFVVPYIIWIIVRNRDLRHNVPALPALAVLFSYIVVSISNTLLRRCAVSVLILLSVFTGIVATFDQSTHYSYNRLITTDEWNIKELLQFSAKNTNTSNVYIMIDRPAVNYNTVVYYNSKEDIILNIKGYWEIDHIQSNDLIIVDQAERIRRNITTDQGVLNNFRYLGNWTLPTHLNIDIYKRI